jgi:hypothetical protein
VGAAIVGGHDLEILVPRAAVSVLVLDARIRKPDVSIVVRQFVFPGPSGNLFGFAIRPAIAVLLAAIVLVEESLILALQLVVENDAPNPTALAAETLLCALVGAIDLRIVRKLARLSEARVIGLARLPGAFLLAPIRFEQVSPTIAQHDRTIIRADGGGTEQTFPFEVALGLASVVAAVVEIAFGDNSE